MSSSAVRLATVVTCAFASLGVLVAPAYAQADRVQGHTDNESQETLILQDSRGVTGAESQVKGVIGGAYVSDWYADSADFDLTDRISQDAYGAPVTATFTGSTRKCRIAPEAAQRQYICGIEWKDGQPTTWVVDVYA